MFLQPFRRRCAKRWRRIQSERENVERTSMKTDFAVQTRHADTVEANQTSVERAIRHMKEHLAEPLGLDELSRINDRSREILH